MAEMETHGENIARVEARIGWAVEEFIREQLCREGQLRLFHAQDLRSYVTAMTGINAPASADRIMRNLRNPQRRLNYKVVSRRESLYEPLWVRPRSGGSPEAKPVEPEPEPPHQGPPVQLELSMAEQTAIEFALAECEAIIEKGQRAFTDVAWAVFRIRDERLYRLSYPTFEEYCRRRWSWGRNYINKQIAAAEVVESLGTMVPKPENERQVRPLAGLPPEVQRDVWSEAVAASPNGKVTERVVREKVQARAAKRPAPHHKKVKEAEAEYVRWFFQEFMKRRKEADLANSRRRWNPEAISKVALIKIMVWVETELQAYLNGHSANARKARKSPQLGNGVDHDRENQIGIGPAGPETGPLLC